MFHSDRPDPPYDVFVPTCGAAKAEVAWTPGFDNLDQISEFIVYLNTSFDEEGIFQEAKRSPNGDATHLIYHIYYK